MSKRIGYYAHQIVIEFVSDGDTFAIVHRHDGLAGFMPVFRTQKLAHKFYGRKTQMLEVWDDDRDATSANESSNGGGA